MMTTKKTIRTRAEAKKLMWEYYSENKASLPKWIGECREEILKRLSDGHETGITFRSLAENEWKDTQAPLSGR